MMHGTSLQRLNLLLPQARMVLGCPLSLPWCARSWKFRVWVEGNEVGSEKLRKNAFYAVFCVSGAYMRWPGAGQALERSEYVLLGFMAPVGASQALARRWTDPFSENDHCDFIHRWIELKFGYVILNP